MAFELEVSLPNYQQKQLSYSHGDKCPSPPIRFTNGPLCECKKFPELDLEITFIASYPSQSKIGKSFALRLARYRTVDIAQGIRESSDQLMSPIPSPCHPRLGRVIEPDLS